MKGLSLDAIFADHSGERKRSGARPILISRAAFLAFRAYICNLWTNHLLRLSQWLRGIHAYCVVTYLFVLFTGELLE